MNSSDISATTICLSVSFEYERKYDLETQSRQGCDLADNTYVQGTQ